MADRLTREIVVDRDEKGAPRITIDGVVLPWFTQGIVPRPPALGELAALTITIPAEKITLADEHATVLRDQEG